MTTKHLRMTAACSVQSRRGAALVFALVGVLIVSIIVLGVTTAANQHYALARTQVDQAAALDVAEAGVNFELNKMTRWEYGEAVEIDNTVDNRFAGELLYNAKDGDKPDPNGGISNVYVADITDNTGKTPWVPPGKFFIEAQGAIPLAGQNTGITRTVRVYGRPVSPGDLFVLYALGTLSLRGSNVAINLQQPEPAYIGASGQADVAVDGVARINGTCIFDRNTGGAGYWADTPPRNWDWLNVPMDTLIPTVDEIGARVVARKANQATNDPLEWFKSNNDNDNWIRARKPNGELTDIVWKDKDGNDLPHNRITPKLWEGNNPNDIVLIGSNAAVAGGFLRGSDFYFESIEIPNGRTLEVQNGVEGVTRQGPVRLWFGPRGGAGDANTKFEWMHGRLIVHYKDSGGQYDHNAFMVYNGSRVHIKIGGNVKLQNAEKQPVNGFCGVLYAYNSDGAGSFGSIELAGDITLRGAAIGFAVIQSSGTLIALPAKSTTPTDPYMYVTHYSLQPYLGTSGWNEPNRYSQAAGAR